MNTIREKRQQLQMTRSDLANKAGVPKVVIFDIETGRECNVNSSVINRIAKALHSNIEELFCC